MSAIDRDDPRCPDCGCVLAIQHLSSEREERSWLEWFCCNCEWTEPVVVDEAG